MLGWFMRGLFVIAGFVASWFVVHEDLHFEIFQMVVAVLLFTLGVGVVAFWPLLKAWFKRIIKK